MIRCLAARRAEHGLALALVETDRRYFELGAEVRRLSHGSLCMMPGLNELAASCVVQRVADGRPSRPASGWFGEIESILAAEQIRMARVYLDGNSTEIDQAMTEHGYRRRGETAFLAPWGHPPPSTDVQLQLVRTGADWSRKLALHTEAMEGPDGYTNQADLWVEMERRKCATGDMQTYLVYRNDQLIGTVGTILHDRLLRMKNIVVVPRLRRQGIALAIVHHLWRMAEADYGCHLGVFGMTGGTGRCLYRRARLCAVTEQFEWSKLLKEPNC